MTNMNESKGLNSKDKTLENEADGCQLDDSELDEVAGGRAMDDLSTCHTSSTSAGTAVTSRAAGVAGSGTCHTSSSTATKPVSPVKKKAGFWESLW